MQTLIHIGTVTSVYDDSDGGRIEVRTNADKFTSEHLDAFPLLPKMFQTAPKVGEAVLVLYTQLGNNQSQRFYIGPIISQPQKQEEDTYYYGEGQATSLFHGANATPYERISNYSETNGAFPQQSDVAIVGRKTEDIILKDGEIDLRCGIRGSQEYTDKKPGIVGNVVFNSINPSYLQLKFRKNKESVANIVADKINLISHQNNLITPINLTNKDNHNGDVLLNDEDMDKLMEQLHQLPYGDVLVKVLNIYRDAFTTHTHPYPMLPPCKDDKMLQVLGFDLNTILSPNIKIS